MAEDKNENKNICTEFPYEITMSIWLGTHNVTNVYHYNTSHQEKSKKQLFTGYRCNHECNFDDKYVCQAETISSYRIICPYINFIFNIKEPRINNAAYSEWKELPTKFKLRQYFNDYATWVYKHTNEVVDKELYMHLRNIEVFALNHITNTSYPFDEWMKRIEKHPLENDPNEIQILHSIPDKGLIRSIIQHYIKELSDFRDGMLLRPFMSDEDADYGVWKDKESKGIKIYELGDYIIIGKYVYSWKKLPAFFSNVNMCGKQYDYYFFLKKDLQHAYEYFASGAVNDVYDPFPARYIAERLKEKGNFE